MSNKNNKKTNDTSFFISIICFMICAVLFMWIIFIPNIQHATELDIILTSFIFGGFGVFFWLIH